MPIVVISTNAGEDMGGEAIKALMYVRVLLDRGEDVHLVTHARCRGKLDGRFPEERTHWVEDDALQRFAWRSRVLGRLIDPIFHRKAAAMIRALFDPADTVLHYLCPISPAVRRFPPGGFRHVVGPLSGNLGHPPAFAAREGRRARLREVIYRSQQRVLSNLPGGLRSANRLLVSGGERTRVALDWAGCERGRMTDVADCGVGEHIAAAARIRHVGRNPRFVFIGRLVRCKGADLAIRALERTAPDVTLSVYGTGAEGPALRALVEAARLGGRVTFHDWLDHGRLPQVLSEYRGLVFPSLQEANGIVVQEAMVLGLPPVVVDWGGPAVLVGDGQGLRIAPGSEEQVVADLAAAMDRLAGDPDLAERLSLDARRRALAEWTWPVVSDSWLAGVPGRDSPIAEDVVRGAD